MQYLNLQAVRGKLEWCPTSYGHLEAQAFNSFLGLEAGTGPEVPPF